MNKIEAENLKTLTFNYHNITKTLVGMKNIIKTIIIIISIGLVTSCDDETGQFNNGMATIQDFSSNKYGYINESKDLVIEKKYDWAGNFYSDYAVVELSLIHI